MLKVGLLDRYKRTLKAIQSISGSWNLHYKSIQWTCKMVEQPIFAMRSLGGLSSASRQNEEGEKVVALLGPLKRKWHGPPDILDMGMST